MLIKKLNKAVQLYVLVICARDFTFLHFYGTFFYIHHQLSTNLLLLYSHVSSPLLTLLLKGY